MDRPGAIGVIGNIQIARRLGEDARVVTAQVDSGLKYLAGELYS